MTAAEIWLASIASVLCASAVALVIIFGVWMLRQDK